VLGFDTVRETSSIASRMGYMSQGFTLYERLSVDENLSFSARIRGVREDQFAVRRSRLLGMAGLTVFAKRRADRLSGGMRKKLALCSNLVHEPPLLLLDEPSLGVDPLSRRELWAMLQDFHRRGATIVLTTSYMDEAELCDRLAFLDGGHIVAIGTPAKLRARAEGKVFEIAAAAPEGAQSDLEAAAPVRDFQRLPGQLRFQIGPEDRLSAELRAKLERHGTLRSVPPTLEDIFVLASPGAAREKLQRRPLRAVGTTVGTGAVQVRHVTCRYGDFVAVDDVSLDVGAGEVFGFLGPNGAGKTTLIKVLCGLLAPSTGKAVVAGADVVAERQRLRHRIGYMSQRFSLYPDLTVDENLRFFAGAYGVAGPDRRDTMASAIDSFELGAIRDRKVAEISGALRQGLALACSLLHRPAVVFLDEPTSGVSPSSRHRFWRLVHALAASGVTAFVTTHYLEEAAYCHRLGLMHQGRLIACGSLADLRFGLQGLPTATVEDVFLAYIERARNGDGGRSMGRGP
jgi:ABC-2 type transport system ATP-binding protein